MDESPQAGASCDRFAATFDTFYGGKPTLATPWIDRRWSRGRYLRYALTFERLGDLAGRHGLDIGCGSGTYIAEAINRHCFSPQGGASVKRAAIRPFSGRGRTIGR